MKLRAPQWIATPPNIPRRIFMKFSDLRDAQKAQNYLHGPPGELECHYLSAKGFALQAFDGSMNLVSNYEGQVAVTALLAGSIHVADVSVAVDAVRRLLCSSGEYTTCQVDVSLLPKLYIRVEFFNVNAADHAVSQLNGAQIGVSRSDSSKREAI